MTGSDCIALEAHDAELNIHRRYEIEVGPDLFGELLVVVRYGRVGSPLREQRFGGLTSDEADRLVRDRLLRRMRARRGGWQYLPQAAPSMRCKGGLD